MLVGSPKEVLILKTLSILLLHYLQAGGVLDVLKVLVYVFGTRKNNVELIFFGHLTAR